MSASAQWQRGTSVLAITGLTLVWIGLNGEFSLANLIGGVLLAVVVTTVLPMPKAGQRGLVIRPIALIRLIVMFIWDVIVAATQIAAVIISGRQPRQAVIRVTTHAHSDGFLAATAGFTALVPGSIVIDVHRLTGTLYIHVFDVPDRPDALGEAHRHVLIQEERILRALASDEELMEAGYRPGGSMKAGRLTEAEFRDFLNARAQEVS